MNTFEILNHRIEKKKKIRHTKCSDTKDECKRRIYNLNVEKKNRFNRTKKKERFEDVGNAMQMNGEK